MLGIGPLALVIAMCRYGFKDYKPHFVCFDCRKTFKKVMIGSWAKQKGLDLAYARLLRLSRTQHQQRVEEEVGTTLQEIVDRYFHEISPCPQCRAKMAALGLDFRAPKQEAKEEWQVVQMLYENGFSFHGCGCGVAYVAPKKMNELKEFFEKYGELSEGEALLKRINAFND